MAVDSLGGDAQPADVQLLQGQADLVGVAAFGPLAIPLAGERRGKGGVEAADFVPRAGFQQYGRFAADGLVLERLDDRARLDRFAREDVGRAQEHAHARPALGQSAGRGRDHGGRQVVVDAAGEEHVEVVAAAGLVEVLLEDFAYGVPQHEAGARAAVAAALPPLEHEPPRPVVEEQPQQLGRRNVQVRGDALLLQFAGLVGAAAGDQRERRTIRADQLQLLAAEFGRHEAQHAHAPGPVAQQFGRPLQEPLDFLAAHQGQGEERQAAVAGNGLGEFGRIAHAGHRPLRDRIARAVPPGQQRTGGQRLAPPGRLHVLPGTLADGLNDPAHGGYIVRPAARRQQRPAPAATGRRPGRRRGGQCLPPTRGASLRPESRPPPVRLPTGGVPRWQRDSGPCRNGRPARTVRRDRRFDFRRRLPAAVGRTRPADFRAKQHLPVEHHAGRAGDDASGRRVQADAALHPDRQLHAPGAALQENERCFRPDAAARLVPLQHDGVGAQPLAQQGLGKAGGLEEQLRAEAADLLNRLLHTRPVAAGQEDDCRGVGQVANLPGFDGRLQPATSPRPARTAAPAAPILIPKSAEVNRRN